MIENIPRLSDQVLQIPRKRIFSTGLLHAGRNDTSAISEEKKSE